MSRKQPNKYPYKQGDVVYRPPPPPTPPKPGFPEPPPTKYISDDGDRSKKKTDGGSKMSNKKSAFLVSLVVVLIVVICYLTWYNHKQNTPDCFSDQSRYAVKQLASKVFAEKFQSLTGKAVPEDTQYAVSDIRLQGVNKDTGSLLCAANFSATSNGEKIKGPIFFSIEKLNQDANFYYTVTFGG